MSFRNFLEEGFSKEEERMLDLLDGKVLEQKETKNYEIHLIRLEAEFVPKDFQVQIAINKKGKSIFSMKDQFTKNPDFDIESSLDEFDQLKAILDEWLDKYEEIGFASQNPKKMKVWKSIMEHLGYKLTKKHAPPMIDEYYIITL